MIFYLFIIVNIIFYVAMVCYLSFAGLIVWGWVFLGFMQWGLQYEWSSPPRWFYNWQNRARFANQLRKIWIALTFINLALVAILAM